MSTAQLTFDIDTLLHQVEVEAAPAWTGAPLRYHEEHRTPAELDAAWERYIFEHGHFGCIPNSHMWNRSYVDKHIDAGAHTLDVFSADAFCTGEYGTKNHRHLPGDLPGITRVQAICEPCGWRHISNDESDVVEAWHDHAFPGWRELPVVPSRVVRSETRGRNRLHEWVEEHYPSDWQQPGRPIITERGGIGTRHVPGRSPFGGYDLSDSAL